jgi:hypothetical protein
MSNTSSTGRKDLVQEIRINPTYTQYFLSEFPGIGTEATKDESKPIVVKRTLFTTDYMKKLSSRATTSILPPNCRYIEETTKGHIVVIEEPPSIRTIKISKSWNHEIEDLRSSGNLEEYGYKSIMTDGERSFTLAFPYVIFILVIEHDTVLVDGMVYLRTQQMRGMADYLFKAPLSNISSSQRVCFGDANMFTTHSLTQTIQNVIMVFWSAQFNTDYTYNYEAYQKHGGEFGNYLRWEYLTKQNPLFIYDASWIKMSNNLGVMIQNIKSEDSIHSIAGMSYNKAAELIFSPSKTEREMAVSRRSKRKMPLYYDIANGMYVGDYFLNIGDPFLNSRGEAMYIDSFIGFSEGGQLKYIMVDKSGKKFMMRLTKKVKDYIALSNKALRYVDEMTLPNNGLKIKSGDVLVFKNKGGNEFYGTVDFIRVGRDGKFEVKLGRDYYIAENIEATKFEISNPTIYDIPLDKKGKYIFIRDIRSSSPLCQGSIVKYTKIQTTSRGGINFEFKSIGKEISGQVHHLPLVSPNTSTKSKRIPKLFREADVKTFNGVFRMGKKLYFLSDSTGRKINSEGFVWELPNSSGIAYEPSYSLTRPKKGMVGSLIKDKTLRLPGFLLDLEFSVGDKVVVADWQNPYDILKVKEIAGFSIVNTDSSRCEDLYFILSDKDGNLSKVKYIYGYSGICYIGKVRKITNAWKRMTAGTKIISNESGYSGFPKSAVNIIIGFITDTGGDDPLVLCSNGQTLWFSDVVNDFTRVTMRSKNWKTLQHSPIDMSKIKPQAGDIINGTKNYKTNEGYFMAYLPKSYRGLRAQFMEYYTGYPESTGMDSSFNREYIYECIPNPRIRPSQVDILGTMTGWPNFHGLFHYSEKSDYHFINEPGRMINVPSSDK